MSRSARVAAGVVASASLSAALALAVRHPLAPSATVVAVLLAAAASARWPRFWLFALPAAVPALDFAPWTGWLAISEFDLLVLALAAGGYARRVVCGGEGAPPERASGHAIYGLLIALALLGWWRGVADAGGWAWHGFPGESGPLDSLRRSKAAFEVLLLWPLLRRDVRAPSAAGCFGAGMLAGLAVVSAVALWERAAFPGLLDFDSGYRTTALFWDMRVGGAAIDVYVALATPFVGWALWHARGPAPWAGAAALALAWTYVVLTTFSRGAWVGALAGVVVLGAFGRLGGPGWRRAGSIALGLAILAEVAVVFVVGSFMDRRVSASADDYRSRVEHWSQGVGLLRTPTEWLLGIGAGRVPARYDRWVAPAEFSGRVHVDEKAGVALLSGPRSRPELGGRFGLTQRVPLQAIERVGLSVRADRRSALVVRVCESHLLYDRACRGAFIGLVGSTLWQRLSVPLQGDALEGGPWYARRPASLTLSVLMPGSTVEVDDVVIEGATGSWPLRNGDFADGLARWMPTARGYFVPWHLDSLWLELLVEHGVLGTMVAGVGGAWLLVRHRRRTGHALVPFLMGSALGVLCVGLVSSVLDAPRTALLALLTFALLCRPTGPDAPRRQPPSPQQAA